MFVRRNKNRSGSISLQIISKAGKRYHVVETVGYSKDPDEIKQLVLQAKNRINHLSGQLKLISTKSQEELLQEALIRDLSNAQIHTIGPELIFGHLFDAVGFRAVDDDLFRHLVIARLVYPTSKLGTVDYLYRYRGIHISVDEIYRFLDDLSDKHQEEVEQISFQHTKKLVDNTVTVVFYDLTTLYFESESEDDLRKTGFSKDGKFRKPQIVLGLLLTTNGYPLGYEVFEGNKFEGHTLIPAIERLETKYDLKRPVVVADAGLLSQDNQETLTKAGYHYILGARIKNESREIKQKILKLNLSDRESSVIIKDKKIRLIVNYSNKRAKKDRHNREKGLMRLEKKLGSGRLTKSHINNRGYNKYLKFEGKVTIAIDYQKFEKDSLWDGLKGYLTNTQLVPETIITHYANLWQIEKAFRISKTDLRIRPIYHYRRKRIEAHLSIAFAAYTVYKELERLLEKHRMSFSPQRAAKLTQTMYALSSIDAETGKCNEVVLKMDAEQQLLYDIVHNPKS